MATLSRPSPAIDASRSGKGHVSKYSVGLVTALMSVALLAFVYSYGGSVPYLDDWDIVPALTGHQAVTAQWLWSQHNEHRLPLPRLLLLGLYHISGFDFRAGMVFNCAALIAMTLLMLHAAARIRGRVGLTDAFIPLLFLCWAHYDNLLWSWQVGFVMATLLAVLALHALCLSPRPASPTAIYLTILICALPLTGAVGLAFAAPLSLWMITLASVYCRHEIGVRTTFALGGLLGLLLICLYFIGYQSAAIQPPHNLREWLSGTVDFLSMGLTPLGRWGVERIGGIPARQLVGYAVSGMLLATLLANLLGRPCTTDFARRSGVAAIAGGALLLAFGVAWGRGGQCAIPRYITLGTPGLMAVYLSTLLQPGWALGSCVRTALLLLAVLIAWPNMIVAREKAQDRLDNKVLPFAQELREGTPPLVLADHYSQPPKAIYPRPRQHDLAADIRMLKEKGIGLFRTVRDDPTYRAIAITPDQTSASGAAWYSLKEKQHVYAVEVSYQYRPLSPAQLWADFRLAWLPAGAVESQARQFATPLPMDGRNDRILVWINEPLGQFHISPDDGNSDCRITAVQLLVKP